MKRMKKRVKILVVCVVFAAAFCIAAFFIVRARFPRHYIKEIRASELDPALVYAMIKAESGFDEKAISRAGAVGLMQLLPSTAEYICKKNGIAFEEEKLFEGAYNVKIGTLYVRYLLEKFPHEETMLAAYNAGEGIVADWLSDETCSQGGVTLSRIPYPETERYIKKVKNFRKIYEILY